MLSGKIALLPVMVFASPQEPPAKSLPASTALSADAWDAAGTLLEACSCAVPCTCNFGQGPTRDFCHTVYAYRLKKAHYGGVVLD